jgi:hypothetical protein
MGSGCSRKKYITNEVIPLKRFSYDSPADAKRQIVRDFHELIDQCPDNEEATTIQRLVRYLQGLLRIKQVVPPVVEIMTILKQEKPKLYHATRRNVLQTSNLHMLFQVEMDPQLARQRMEEYLQ